jgi:hypothetical protein
VNSASLNGIVLAFTGMVVAGLGFLPLATPAGINPCDFIVGSGSGVICAEQRGLVAIGYYLAVAGSALATIGVWQAGIGRGRIVREGSWLVIAIGAIVLVLGFLAFATLPYASVTSAAIGYFFGLLGSVLLIGGMIKLEFGVERFSLASP